jgi:hypothetical protein
MGTRSNKTITLFYEQEGEHIALEIHQNGSISDLKRLVKGIIPDKVCVHDIIFCDEVIEGTVSHAGMCDEAIFTCTIEYLPTTSSNGSVSWYKNRLLHRDGDLPALILADGSQEWYCNGLRHRNCDLPAVIATKTSMWNGGCEFWYKHGKLHREGDLPSVDWHSTHQLWYKEGLLHRDNRPAEVWVSGSEVWYQHGKKHRDGYPAHIKANGRKDWYNHGKKVRCLEKAYVL